MDYQKSSKNVSFLSLKPIPLYEHNYEEQTEPGTSNHPPFLFPSGIYEWYGY